MSKKNLSIILLVVGVALIAWGYQVSGEVGSQISSTFSGQPTNETLIFYIAGGILALVGLVGIVKK
jgi:drug/metabolite transporter (DMT)-like permease